MDAGAMTVIRGSQIILVGWVKSRLDPTSSQRPLAVHPHTCGEQKCLPTDRLFEIGSSPHVWGTEWIEQPLVLRDRFIPTRVGNRLGGRPELTGTPVHPHVRGENSRQHWPHISYAGSPPRAWGQWTLGPLGPLWTRFTPTCVGTIVAPQTLRQSYSVHPHVRGDNVILRPHIIVDGGSPPRAWGQLHLVRTRLRRLRFTPTCVGTISTTVACAGT